MIDRVAVHKAIARKLTRLGFGITGWDCYPQRAVVLGLKTKEQLNRTECSFKKGDCPNCPAFYWKLDRNVSLHSTTEAFLD